MLDAGLLDGVLCVNLLLVGERREALDDGLAWLSVCGLAWLSVCLSVMHHKRESLTNERKKLCISIRKNLCGLSGLMDGYI